MVRKILLLSLAALVSVPSIALAAGPSSNRAYLGKPVDPGFGLVDLKNRWYDPSTQRFLSLDPVFWEVWRIPKQPGGQTPDWQRALRSSQAQNPTGYASGNPIRYSDPEGRCVTDPVLATICLVALKLAPYYANDDALIAALAAGQWLAAETQEDRAAAAPALGLATWNLALPNDQPNPAPPGVGGKSPKAKAAPAEGKAAAATVNVAASVSRAITIPRRQLQHAFEHAPHFGVTGKMNSKTLTEFSNVIQDHVASPNTSVINGTFRGKSVTHFVNPMTGLNVIRDANGNFLSGWHLTAKQLKHVMTNGKLGGGD